MMSISKYMDEYDIAQEVRLERKLHKGSFFLLEGKTDIARFTKFIDENRCSIVNCFGKRKVIGAIRILYDEGFLGALGAVDADFDRVDDTIVEHEGLIYSETHDFDLDWIQPDVLQQYLAQVGDKEKCALHGSPSDLIGKIVDGLKPISVARFLNKCKQIPYKLSEIDASDCFENFKVDVDKYVRLIFKDRTTSEPEINNVKTKINNALGKNYVLYQITNGHDFHCALGACLRQDLGSRRDVHSWGSEVEIHLRLAFNDYSFKSSVVYRAIRNWEAENRPFRVLDQRL